MKIGISCQEQRHDDTIRVWVYGIKTCCSTTIVIQINSNLRVKNNQQIKMQIIKIALLVAAAVFAVLGGAQAEPIRDINGNVKGDVKDNSS
ncbi:hypothetical protein HA402_005707 [Bradysia odoriphaga]|nr:hypothetical protein HA402_005707 [Bradysia odoriphaga]